MRTAARGRLEGGGGERREQSSCPALVIDTDSRLEAGGWPRLAQAARCCTSSGPCVRVATGHGAVTLDRWADPLQIQLQTSAANYNITTCCQAPTKMAQHFPIGAGNSLQTCIRLILMMGCYVVWAGLVSVSLMRCLCALGHHQASQFEYLEEN